MSGFFGAAESFFGHLAGVSWPALAVALLLHLVKVAVSSRAWRNILAAAYPETSVPWRGIFGAQAAGLGLGVFAPTRGGDLLKLFLAKRQIPGSRYPTLAATVIVESLFDFLVGVALIVAAIQLGVLPGLDASPGFPALAWITDHPAETAGAVLILLGATTALALRLGHHAVAFWRRVAQGFAVLGNWRVYVRRVALWQSVDWLLRIVTLYWFLRAFGLTPDLHNAFLVQVAQNASALVPLTPSGIGTEQALVTYVLADRFSTTELLSFSIGMKLALIWTNLALGVGAVALMLRTLRWRRALVPESIVPGSLARQELASSPEAVE